MLAVVLAGVLAMVSALHAQRVRVGAVADLAALAGGDVSAVATWTPVDGRACDQAALVVRTNGMVLADCEVRGTDTLVVVDLAVDLGPVAVDVRARARAGPEDR